MTILQENPIYLKQPQGMPLAKIHQDVQVVHKPPVKGREKPPVRYRPRVKVEEDEDEISVDLGAQDFETQQKPIRVQRPVRPGPSFNTVSAPPEYEIPLPPLAPEAPPLEPEPIEEKQETVVEETTEESPFTVAVQEIEDPPPPPPPAPLDPEAGNDLAQALAAATFLLFIAYMVSRD